MIAQGRTLGILGGGQLGRMLALDARRLGYRVLVMDDDPGGPAAQVADQHHRARLDNAEAASRFAACAATVTIETEHVSLPVLEAVARVCPILPRPEILAALQDRLAQRRWLERLGLPQPAFAPVDDDHAPVEASARIGAPAIMKTRRGGYDGRGQVRIHAAQEAASAWEALGAQPAVLERFVRFRREISVVMARGRDGSEAVYPVIENVHRDHVLHTSLVPSTVSAQVAATAVNVARTIARGLAYVGVLAVEMFVTEDEALLVNEIAPRVHNSGHVSQGACITSQFEQHVRAVLGLPLGAVDLLTPAVMVNLLGDLWARGEPDWADVLAVPSAQLHLYGKAGARPGRKMGHVIVRDRDPGRALSLADGLLARLARSGSQAAA